MGEPRGDGQGQTVQKCALGSQEKFRPENMQVSFRDYDEDCHSHPHSISSLYYLLTGEIEIPPLGWDFDLPLFIDWEYPASKHLKFKCTGTILPLLPGIVLYLVIDLYQLFGTL